ncbi:MAG TPA: hypothetical protein VFM88_22785 [Vicinamibacteria bacterium]|nr:hypothetical protein [Vicinamibacteria bacterium]
MARTEEAYGRLLDEIASEKAAALRRIAGRLEAILAELDALREALAAAPAERLRLVVRFNEARDQARLHRWFLEVQREAVGLFRHDDLDAFYRVPAPIRD